MSASRTIDRTLAALADPHRRKAVELLGRGPLRAGELAEALKLPAPAMSRHLRALKQSGLVEETHPAFDARVRIYFEVVTRSAVGPKWREASPEQRQKLQAEFKTLLVRVYSGALTQIRDQTVEITRSQPVANSSQVIVQSEVRGKGEPIKLDYRLDKFSDAWKIIDVNVGGIWLVQSYRSQFAQVLGGAGGIDALITRLVDQNKTAGGTKS